MRPIKLITVVAVVSCSLAVSSARAQNVTNAVTFTAVAYEEGSVTTNGSGTTATYVMNKKMYTTADLLAEINTAITTNKFSKAAKLVLIVTGGNLTVPSYAVIDGTNFYDLSPAGYNIINPGASVGVKSGTEGITTPEGKLTEVDYYNFYYNDTHYLTDADEGLFIYLNGVGTFTGTDTATNSAGAYTETYKASVPNLTGTGHSGTNYFFMTGMLSASGSARE